MGYGKAVNNLLSKVYNKPEYIAILNTDLSWPKGTFENMIHWMDDHSDISLMVPQILSPLGQIQKLCKRNPTVLALISRRFIPDKFKPSILKNMIPGILW